MWVGAVCADRLTILRDERDVVLASRIDEFKYDLFTYVNDRDVVTMGTEFGAVTAFLFNAQKGAKMSVNGLR